MGIFNPKIPKILALRAISLIFALFFIDLRTSRAKFSQNFVAKNREAEPAKNVVGGRIRDSWPEYIPLFGNGVIFGWVGGIGAEIVRDFSGMRD